MTPPLVYRIDDQDRIGFLNEAYLQDAVEGGSVEQGRAGLLGHSLWRVLRQAADWYGPLIRRVRTDNVDVRLRCRYDTPSLRRLMRMRNLADGRRVGAVRIVHHDRPATAVLCLTRPSPAISCRGLQRGRLHVNGRVILFFSKPR